jgi:hypothetical protein
MDNAFARRAVLKKQGFPDIRFELHSNGAASFTIFENGKQVGVFWKTVSPHKAMWGKDTPMSLEEAFQRCAAQRFPDYTVMDLEEAFHSAI